MKKLLAKLLQDDNYAANVESYHGHVKKHKVNQTNSKFNERIWV